MLRPATKEAYALFHEGVQALSQVEANGIRVDEKYLKKALQQTEKEVNALTTELRDDEVYRKWQRKYGAKTNLDSRSQLADVIFNVMGYKAKYRTGKGNLKSDKSSFEHVDLDFVKKFLIRAEKQKLHGTYLSGIQREVCDGLLHAVFNLHLAATMRSSSDSPNFQNFPIRNPESGKLIRKCFIPRKNHVIVEIDEGGIEVRVAACYHKDPVMMKYINDPTKDMHRDMAAQCYKSKTTQVSKAMRHCGKNMFVFPQFYGDYYVNSARVLWEAMDQMKLELADGSMSVKDHLRKKGIKQLGACDPEQSPVAGTFEKHIQEVEHDFWNNRFRKYGRWKRNWWQAYCDKGYFDTLTGFHFEGPLRKNEVINYPVQGSAFHILLWALTQLNKWLRKNKMRSMIVGQIHDSMVLDVHVDEYDEVIAKAVYFMTKGVRKHWSWIITPLEVEAEACPVGGSWHDKKKVELAA